MVIPNGPQDLTPQWLTQALHQGGAIDKVSILSLQANTLSTDAGITGQLARLRLAYDTEEEGAPQTLIAKLHSADPAMRASAKLLRTYESEVRFYRQIAHQIDLRTPHCYYGAFDETAASVLLLEDLAPACCGDTLVGCSANKAELAIREVAQFHAAWWESPSLSALNWLPQWNAVRYRQYLDKLVQVAQERHHSRAQEGRRSPPIIQELGERVFKHYADLADHLELQPPRTLIHHDYHLDNLFFSSSQGGIPFAVIDWQMFRLGKGVYDVAFFMCRSMSAKDRRAHEMDLLRIYHATLIENGVEGYGFEQCMYDYSLSMLECLARIAYIISAPKLTPQTRHRYIDILLPRNSAAIQDLHATDLLPE